MTTTKKFFLLNLLLLLTISCVGEPPKCDLPDLQKQPDLISPPDLTTVDMTIPIPTPLPKVRIPAGFSKYAERQGVVLYKKPYISGVPDYVLVIDITQIDLRSIFGPIDPMNERPNSGPYGGPDPLVTRYFMTDWENYILGGVWFFTGQFFNPANHPTQIALGITEAREENGKTIKKILVDGADTDAVWENQKMMLEIWPGKSARIDEFTLAHFKDLGRAPQAIVGLSENASKSPQLFVGRTFLGTGIEVDLPNREVAVDHRLLFVFTTEKSNQLDAGSTLRRFGATRVMMLDGGGSVKLRANDQVLVNGVTDTPHVFGLYPRQP